MTRRWLSGAALWVSVTSGNLAAQADGLVAYPGTYQVQFENQWVRLVRIRLAGNANLGMHSHPAGFMFHVYLNDAEPIWFNHDGVPHEIMRPAVTARSYRVGRATPETHAVVNPSARMSDYMRIEYKTRGSEAAGRRYWAEPIGTANTSAVEHTGQQSRVTRVTIAAGASQEFAAGDGQPALLLLVTDGTISEDASGTGRTVKVGQERFVDANGRVTIRNTGAAPIQLLRFDFLTAP